MHKKKPNFLIAGAAKSGTTSLYKYLKQHPQVFMSNNKEPMFMISTIYKHLSRKDPRYKEGEKILVSSFNDYLNLFEEVIDEIGIGEASAAYLYYYETAIPNIHKYLGDTKIIILLRNPVERAYSSYSHLVKEGAETSSFENFIKKEEKRRIENWDILNYPIALGFYYNQVKAYMDSFSEVKVYLFEDFIKHPVETVKKIYGFLGVDKSFVPNTNTKHNQSVNNNRLLRHIVRKDTFIKKLARMLLSTVMKEDKISRIGRYMRGKNIKKPQMNTETIAFLKNKYREDVIKLQDLVNRNLEHWH